MRDDRIGRTHSWNSNNLCLRLSVGSVCQVITLMAEVFATVHINLRSRRVTDDAYITIKNTHCLEKKKNNDNKITRMRQAGS